MVGTCEAYLESFVSSVAYKTSLTQLTIPGFFLVHWRSDSQGSKHNLWIIRTVHCYFDNKKICQTSFRSEILEAIEKKLNV